MAFDDYEVQMRPMTSDEVLDLLGAAIVASPFLKVADLCRETPANALLEACDFSDARTTGQTLNTWFGISLAPEAWASVLPPPLTRQLGAVCDLIARHATVPVVQPVTLFGDPSLAAGAFLVIRRTLADAGVDVADLRPSSPLEPYLREHATKVLPPLWRLTPPGLCPVHVDEPLGTAAGVGMPIARLLYVIGWCAGLPGQYMLAAGLSVAIFWCLAAVGGRLIKPAGVRFGDARTFRDLARIIVGERCAFQGFPVVTR